MMDFRCIEVSYLIGMLLKWDRNAMWSYVKKKYKLNVTNCYYSQLIFIQRLLPGKS